LASSGHDIDEVALPMLDAGACSFIRKPFLTRDLARQICRVLDRQSQSQNPTGDCSDLLPHFAAAGRAGPGNLLSFPIQIPYTSSKPHREAAVIVVNTETIPGYRILEVKGIVQGNTVRAKHVGRDIAAGLKNLVGGELGGYTELLTESRRQALERMMAQATELGANAVVNVRFTTSAVTQGAAELYAYGTAVMVEPGA
jgi:uncharacterized protein YbjQ (UPF0145 family)